MTTTTAAGLDPAEQYAADRNRLWVTATAALTAAAKLTHPTGHQLDFADFLADALAAVTANLGGVEELLAGRSGSWEAALVDQLVNGTLGYDPIDAELIRRRTEPVTVTLNVASLVDEHAAPGNGPYIDALDQLDARYDGATEAEQEHLDLAAGELHRDWTDRYTAYADRFTAAVHAAAARLGVTVPVTVEASTDPDNVYGEPDNTGDPGWADRPTDLLAWQLWRAGARRPPDRRADRPSRPPDPATGSGAATSRSPAPPGQ